jgi:UDP-glucose:(heptosyl)LPS alpha-1,3-glucosyltransferase
VDIALVILQFDPAHSGAERYTHDLSRALAKAGHRATILSREALPRGSGPGRLAPFIASLAQHFARNRYDIVHAMTPVPGCDLYHAHGGVAAAGAEQSRFASVERELLGGDDPPVVLCVSELVRRSVRQHYRLPEEKLLLLFNAVDLERFDPQRRRDAGAAVRERFAIGREQAVALMVGADWARKGLREAIAATAQVDALTLLVVGGGDPAAFQAQAAAAGIAGRVHFAGAVEEPCDYYRAADFFVLPTRHDPCSLAVLEALAMGLPVVSTALNGACEVMRDGVHGFVLQDPADVGALAQAMRRMMDALARHAMSAACLGLRPQLSSERHLQGLLDIYHCVRPAIDARHRLGT